MNRKQLLTVTALLGLLLGTKLVDYYRFSQGEKPQQGVACSQCHPSHQALAVTKAEYLAHPPYISNLHFAREYLPLGDQQIVSKMRQHLKDYSFEQVRTYRMHELAGRKLPIVEEILASYGIPADFKYIPLVESGLTSNATSIKGASGYWQFMPATARAFGLTVNEEVDERQDLVKSTHAAARYILALYDEFENWTLAAAAYNVGSGSLRNTIRHQAEDNYFKLKLNRETSAYVYRLISVKEVIENPTRHGYARYNEEKPVGSPQLAQAMWKVPY